MTLNGSRPCAFPPHPRPAAKEDQELHAEKVTESAARRFAAWLRHAPAERVPLPAIPAVWTATEILHLAGVADLYPGAATVAAAGLAYGVGERRARDSEHKRLRGAEVAAITGAAGAWVTAGTVWGPLAGPYHLLSLAYLAGSGAGYWWLRRHEAVQAARARRDDAAAWWERKAAWHRLAPHLGLRGSHLLEYSDTLLGDTMLIDTRGTGKRASQISARDVAERLGEIEMIPAGRIDVTTDRIPGRLRITVRRKDPWAAPLLHPATHPDSPYARHVEVPATCRKPLIIGADPETGRPLGLTVWDPEEGGKVVMIVAKKGSGKTVLMSDITERITACADAQLIQVNLGKHREDSRWRPLSAASALGREDLGRARRILQWVVEAIEERSRTGSDSKVQPSARTPLLVVKIDEIDQVARDPVCKQLLSDIASKCRSEAVALIFAGQRATAQWVGGGDLRANVDIVLLGRFGRPGEARKATGEEIDLPDMGEYGEGQPGVWLAYELGGGGHYERGRVFMLEDPAEIEAIVAQRLADRQPYTPEPALARLGGPWDKITGVAPDEGDEEEDADVTASSPVPGGTVIQATGRITAKIDQARAVAADVPPIPPIPPGMEQHAAQLLAERQRQALAQNYGDVTIPAQVASVLLSLLASPGGTTSSQAAQAIGKSKPAAHRYLSALRASGLARIDGSGRGSRFVLAAEPGGRPRPALSVVPPPGDENGDHEDGQDDAPAAGYAQLPPTGPG